MIQKQTESGRNPLKGCDDTIQSKSRERDPDRYEDG